MDFIVDLPFMTHKFDLIWVISTHFIPIHMNYDVHKYVGIYIAPVLCKHRVSNTIISD
jgi:hypothetical protein